VGHILWLWTACEFKNVQLPYKIPLNYFDLVRSAKGLAPVMPTPTLPHHHFRLSELFFFHGKSFVCFCSLSPRKRLQGNKIKPGVRNVRGCRPHFRTLNCMWIKKFNTHKKILYNYFDLVRSAKGLVPVMPTPTLPHHYFRLSELLFFHGKIYTTPLRSSNISSHRLLTAASCCPINNLWEGSTFRQYTFVVLNY